MQRSNLTFTPGGACGAGMGVYCKSSGQRLSRDGLAQADAQTLDGQMSMTRCSRTYG